MPSTTLVPVFTGTLAGQPTQLCNARDLHAFLGVGRDFSNWVTDRIAEYGFQEGEDYSPILANRSDGRPGKRRTDYHLTLDMAKELAMIENNDQGRAVRRYFIACEKAAHSTPPAGEVRNPQKQLRNPQPSDVPREVRQAVNRRAYALSHDVYEQLRVWLTERVQHRCQVVKSGAWVDLQGVVDRTTLDDWLHTHHADRARALLTLSQALQRLTLEWSEKLAAEVQHLAPDIEARPLSHRAAGDAMEAAGVMLSQDMRK